MSDCDINELDLFAYAAANLAAQHECAAANADAAAEVEVPDSEAAALPESAAERSSMSLHTMQQLAFGFITSLRPDGAAQQVPAGKVRHISAAAGFWRRLRGRERPVERTVLVALCPDVSSGTVEFRDRAERVERVNLLRAELERLEEEIRISEPHLADCDDLFCEFRTWNYAASANVRYHDCRRELDRELSFLIDGGRIDRLRLSGVADYCYLAAPAEVAESALGLTEWGVVRLGPGYTFEVLREAPLQSNVTPEKRQQFALNIAQSAAASARFAAGVELLRSGNVSFRKPPRRRGRMVNK
jgi:hypothetical protein